MHKKTISAILAASLILTLSASCSKTEEPVIKEARYYQDGPWWDAEIIETDLSDLENVRGTNVIAANEDYYILEIYFMADPPTLLRRYNYDGELCGEIQPSDYTDLSIAMFEDNGKFYAVSDLIYEADFDNGAFVDPVTPNTPPATKMFTGINRIVKYQDNYIYLYCAADFNGTEEVFVIDDGENMEVFEPDFGDDVDVFYVINMMMYDDKLVFEADVEQGDDHTEYICTLDPETMEMVKTPMSDAYFGGAFLADIGAYYTVSSNDYFNTEISKYDPETNEFVEILNFADTPVNNMYGSSVNYHVVYADDSRVVVTTEKEGITWGNGDPVFITLTKAETNPNVGKQVLELGNIADVPYGLYRAISEFNLNNDDYFIEPVRGYYEYDKTDGEMADILMNDIRSGNGPDMVICNSNHAVLNDERYLRKTDDGSYRYDYGVRYNGLIVKTSLLSDPSAVGITYEEYLNIISENNNGINTLGTRIDTFNTLFKFSADKFFDRRGHVDLSGEDFRAMAEFVAGLSEPASRTDYYAAPVINNATYNGFTGFFINYGNNCNKYSIIGYPTRDGSRSETVSSEGIGITSCCSSEEGCIAFINSLSSPEIQCRLSNILDPVSEQALRLKSDIIVDENNRNNRNSPLAGPGGWPSDAVDHYIGQVSDAVAVPDVDSTVLVILDEEIQPYLEGQKSLDEVIRAAESRINLMIDERG